MSSYISYCTESAQNIFYTLKEAAQQLLYWPIKVILEFGALLSVDRSLDPKRVTCFCSIHPSVSYATFKDYVLLDVRQAIIQHQNTNTNMHTESLQNLKELEKLAKMHLACEKWIDKNSTEFEQKGFEVTAINEQLKHIVEISKTSLNYLIKNAATQDKKPPALSNSSGSDCFLNSTLHGIYGNNLALQALEPNPIFLTQACKYLRAKADEILDTLDLATLIRQTIRFSHPDLKSQAESDTVYLSMMQGSTINNSLPRLNHPSFFTTTETKKFDPELNKIKMELEEAKRRDPNSVQHEINGRQSDLAERLENYTDSEWTQQQYETLLQLDPARDNMTPITDLLTDRLTKTGDQVSDPIPVINLQRETKLISCLSSKSTITPPPILVMHYKRRIKQDSLSSRSHPHYQLAHKINLQPIFTLPATNIEGSNYPSGCQYSIYHFTCWSGHLKTKSNGHYISYFKSTDNIWWKCDDSSITKADDDQVNTKLQENAVLIMARKESVGTNDEPDAARISEPDAARIIEPDAARIIEPDAEQPEKSSCAIM